MPKKIVLTIIVPVIISAKKKTCANTVLPHCFTISISPKNHYLRLTMISRQMSQNIPFHVFPWLNSLRTIPVPVLQIMEWHSFYVGWESRKTGFLPPVPSANHCPVCTRFTRAAISLTTYILFSPILRETHGYLVSVCKIASR